MTEIKSYREVQDTLGDRFIASVREFVASDLDSVADLANGLFKHVGDRKHREAIARAFYEGRWIYKTGLALLVTGDAQSAHVRSQAFSYGTVCEGLLSDFIGFGLSKGLLKAKYFKYWPFAGSCEGPQDAGNGFPAILRPGFARVEFQREPMLRRVSTQFRKSLSDKMLGFEKPAKGQLQVQKSP
jgi:hypothetical protein